MRIWFHGTNEAESKLIAEYGFKTGTYFAAALEDALEFGGEYVFMVALDYASADHWQISVPHEVSEKAIVRLTKYKPLVLVDYPDRRKAVFAANTQSG